MIVPDGRCHTPLRSNRNADTRERSERAHLFQLLKLQRAISGRTTAWSNARVYVLAPLIVLIREVEPRRPVAGHGTEMKRAVVLRAKTGTIPVQRDDLSGNRVPEISPH